VTPDIDGAGTAAPSSRSVSRTADEKLGAIARKSLEIRMQTIAY
jgi:hypothetical protein